MFFHPELSRVYIEMKIADYQREAEHVRDLARMSISLRNRLAKVLKGLAARLEARSETTEEANTVPL
jgi:hypothetical protein